MKGSKNRIRYKMTARSTALFLAAALLLALPAAAYDRQEATTATGGTEITVYAGTQNSNDQGNYLADPGDYLAFNRYQTAGTLESVSNITSSTNFIKTLAPDGYVVHGGVEGVSWDGTTNTLTLNNASGTVITVEGPALDVANLNTYNSNLSTVIDVTMPNLTYYKQFDMFTQPDGTGGAPHTKDNTTMQDVVYINITGNNSFHNIRLSGNVKVVFTGTGTLTLDAADGQDWNYDDYSEPDFDALSHPASYAVSSYPTIGHNGSLMGEDSIGSTMPNGMVRTITENYEYALPEIALKDMEITQGGTIHNAAQVKGEDYFTFTGSTAPTDESRIAEAPAGVDNTYSLAYGGAQYNMVYNDAKTEFYVTTTSGMGPNTTTTYYNVSADIKAWDPWESYIGTDGAPAAKVVISHKSDIARSQQTLTVNGESAAPEAYVINGSTYYKMRDIAALLNGTSAQFAVDFDAARNIYVKTGEAYISVGGELTGSSQSTAAVSNDWTLNINGKQIAVTAYSIGGNNFFQLNDLSDAIGFDVEYMDNGAAVSITTSTLLAAVLHDDGANWVEDDQYGSYFKEGSALEGVKTIIAAGRCSINGYAIPAAEEALGADGYLVNGSAWLTKTDEGWKVDRNTYDSYADAAVAVLRLVRAGQESLLYDDDGDGYADRIKAKNVAALIVGAITENGDGTYTVVREEFASAPEQGRPYDGQLFAAGSNEAAVKLDPALKAGDMALAWYGPDGWVLDRAVEANGILVYGEDHGYYQIDGVQYDDAMRFSRDNIVVSNRCGELTNAHKYFGFMNNEEGLKVSLWLAPTVDPNNSGAPAGFTTGENAKIFLERAIADAKAKLDAVDMSSAGEDVTAACGQVNDAIAAAEEALASETCASMLDYHVYMLYLNLHGMADDIGARFAGYDYIIGLEAVTGGNE